MWIDVHPASELGQEQIDLEMFDQIVSSLASGVDQATTQTIESATGDRPPSWQLQMDEARRQIANGDNYVLMRPSGVFVFYNNPQPFCYRYMIPGEWVAAQEGNLYQSKDGLAHAGVAFTLTRALDGLKGKTFAERAQNFIARGYKELTGQRLKGVKLTPLDASRFPVWKLTADPLKQGRDTRVELATKFVVDLGPDAFAVITVGGTEDDDALARGIIDSLQTTTDAPCYWSDLEALLRSTGSLD
jgi:hypothetical protein